VAASAWLLAQLLWLLPALPLLLVWHLWLPVAQLKLPALLLLAELPLLPALLVALLLWLLPLVALLLWPLPVPLKLPDLVCKF
jgi:hypothetical protein